MIKIPIMRLPDRGNKTAIFYSFAVHNAEGAGVTVPGKANRKDEKVQRLAKALRDQDQPIFHVGRSRGRKSQDVECWHGAMEALEHEFADRFRPHLVFDSGVGPLRNEDLAVPFRNPAFTGYGRNFSASPRRAQRATSCSTPISITRATGPL
jgi:hypothetical protein